MNNTGFQLVCITAIGILAGLATSPPKYSVASVAHPAIEPIPAVTTPVESPPVTRTVTVPAGEVVTPSPAGSYMPPVDDAMSDDGIALPADSPEALQVNAAPAAVCMDGSCGPANYSYGRQYSAPQRRGLFRGRFFGRR